MTGYRIQETAVAQIEDIYIYTAQTWGDTQADTYVRGLHAMFDDIAARRVIWRSVPAIVRVSGYVRRYRHHFVYWREMEAEWIGIVAVLHERMHQSARLEQLFRDDP